MNYIYIIEVKATAPQGYKPRTKTYKGVSLSKHKGIEGELKQKAISIVSNGLSETNPNVHLRYSTKVEVRKSDFFLDIDDELDGIETIKIPIEIEKGGEK
jgi:hypothetical protein